MLHILKDFPDNVVAAKASGQVTGKDYENVMIPAVEEALKLYGAGVLGPIEQGDKEYGGGRLRSLQKALDGRSARYGLCSSLLGHSVVFRHAIRSSRRHGLLKWRAKYVGLEASDAKRLRRLRTRTGG